MRPARTIIVGGGVGGMAFAAALQRLGLLPPFPARDRLAERESGRDGFAKPPR